MDAVTPAEFYKANIDKEKEYVRVYVAREVKQGEEISVGFSRLNAAEDGYEVEKGIGFLNKKEFAAQTTSVEELELPLPKKDLDEKELQNITPVKKGTCVTMHMGGAILFVKVLIDRDGFVVTKENGQLFMSNFELTSRFNYSGHRHTTKKETVVTMNDQKPLKGIILDERIVFAFKDSTQSAPAGSLLMPDPDSEDGYHLERPIYHLNTQLRVSANWTARQTSRDIAQTQHDAATEKQARLNANAPRVRPRRIS